VPSLLDPTSPADAWGRLNTRVRQQDNSKGTHITKLVVVLGIVTARIILAPVLHDIAGLVAAID
jgi:hypothetical protein